MPGLLLRLSQNLTKKDSFKCHFEGKISFKFHFSKMSRLIGKLSERLREMIPSKCQFKNVKIASRAILLSQ